MTDFGYTMMCEQCPPDQLVRDLQMAEQAGFGFSVISDHYQPWLESQGHSGYAWSILGAAAHATERIGLMTYVNADLPNPESFESATQFVSPEQVGDAISCGSDVEEHVEAIRPYIDAGFTEVALVQIGADQQEPFIRWAQEELLPALQSL